MNFSGTGSRAMPSRSRAISKYSPPPTAHPAIQSPKHATPPESHPKPVMTSKIVSTQTPTTSGFLQISKLRLPWATNPPQPPEPGPKTEGQEPILYLAYGSNLCAATFLGRRGITPLSRRNVVVPRLKLVFDLQGLPYIEPRFANVRVVGREHPPERDLSLAEREPLLEGAQQEDWNHGLVGVVYEVTPQDFAKIISTEGSSYNDVVVDCIPLPSTGDPFLPSPSSSTVREELLSITPVKAHTLLVPPSKTRHTAGQPSLRYLSLIRTGAAENNLPASYQSYLASLEPYHKTRLRQKVGAALYLMLWLPVIIVILGLGRVCAGKNGRVPKWLAGASEGISALMWGYYDGFYRKIFGDGEVTEAERKRLGKANAEEGVGACL